MSDVVSAELDARLEQVPTFAGRPRMVEALTGGKD